MSGREGFLNRFRVLGTALAFLFLGVSSLAANGVQENRIAEARQLIAAKNYNDALVILRQVVAEEPERLDEALELINQVNRIRNQFNSDYEKVLDLLYVEDNVDEALLLIEKIQGSDPNPNKQVASDVKQMKRSAQIKDNNKKYNDIMTRALAFLNRREYGQAVQVYLEGYTLARAMFLEEGYGNVLNNQIDRAWEDLKAASALFVQAEARLKALPPQGTAVLASASSTVATMEPLLATLRDLAQWRQRAWSDGRLFQTQGQFLIKNGRQEDFYLLYSNLMVNGPPEASSPEGILGAMDRIWNEALDPWTAQIRAEVETRTTAAKLALDQGRYQEASTAFELLRTKARQGLEVTTLWNRVAGVDATGALDAAYRTRLAQVLPLGLWLERRLVLAGQGLQASRDLPRGLALAADQGLDRSALEAARGDVRNQKNTYAAFDRVVGGWGRQNQSLGALGYTLVDPATYPAVWQAVWNGYRQRAQAQEAVFVDRRGGVDFGVLDSRFAGLQTSLTAARNQVEGTTKYPLQASVRLTELRPLQDSLAQDIGSFVSLYEGEASDVKTAPVLAWPVKGRELLTRLTAAQTLQGQLLAVAQANYAQSQSLKKAGQDLEASVKLATAAENFTKAKADLNTMSTRFADSLRFQEDPAFRVDSDALVKLLGDLILKGENEVVVREVRQLINQGSDAYQALNFRQSEQILLRAQKRWADTNKDPNSEVEYWLRLTSYALSVNTGRELSPIDPLYNEVQQLLNFARRDYTLGKDKIAAGEREAGLALMGQASVTLGKILLTAPQNQEAGLLKLEILKASDPENFPALYKQNFDNAVAKIGTDSRTAYSDLQDLDKIQPGYPGMQAAIKRVRQDLNLDPKEVDQKALADARALVTQAQRLFDGGTPAQLTEAQARVRRALALDPKNRAAQDLSDKISLRITNFVATLTPSQRGELNDMIDLLRNQRNLEALSKITEFKAKYPAVANDPEVREYERRIKAVN